MYYYLSVKCSLEKINEASIKFLEPLSLQETYVTIVNEAIRITDGNFGSIFLVRNGSLEKVYVSKNELREIKIRKRGYTYRTFKFQKPFIIDASETSKIHPLIKKFGIKSTIFVPLVYKGKSIGVLTIDLLEIKHFTDQQMIVLKLFGSLASMAIKKSEMHENMEKALEERDLNIVMEETLEKINKSALKFLEPLSLPKIYSTIVEEAIKLVEGDAGQIMLEIDKNLQIVHGSSSLVSKVKPRKKGFTQKVFSSRKSLVIHDKTILKTHPEVWKLGIKSSIFIPLSFKNKSIGVLVVMSKENTHFTAKKLVTLKLFGSFATLAIRKAQLYDEAQKAIKVRDLFISIAAHEFRTPLTSINGYIQLLHNRLNRLDSPEAKWIQHLSVESFRLTNLIKELLEINHIQAGKLQYFFQECNIKDITNQAINNFYFTYPDRKIIFNSNLAENESLLIGDPDKLVQAIRNLLENAAKYSPIDKNIFIDLGCKDKFINFKIADEGKGILKSEIPLIFKGFYKGSNSGEEGMGLGLYLARNIIREHHGLIRISSKVNKGTIVEIKLPQQKHE